MSRDEMNAGYCSLTLIPSEIYPFVHVEEEGRVAKFSEERFDGVMVCLRSKEVFNSAEGNFSWKVVLEEYRESTDDELAIGVASGMFFNSEVPGHDVASWALFADGTVWHEGIHKKYCSALSK